VTVANSSETVSTGGVIATHTIGGVEFQVVLVGDGDGHIVGSRPSYSVFYTPATNALNLEIGELFNTSTSVVRVRGIWLMPTNTSITGIQLGYDLNRISAVGTGGTVETPRPYDTTAPALAAGITARRGATGGATLVYKYWTQYNFNEETNAANQLLSLTNQLPLYGDRVEEIILRQNQGVQIKIGALSGTAAGQTGAKIDFVVDN
jgi:hypothetical protein